MKEVYKSFDELWQATRGRNGVCIICHKAFDGLDHSVCDDCWPEPEKVEL